MTGFGACQVPPSSRVLPSAPLADYEAAATQLDRARSYHRREQGKFVSPAMHIQHWDIEGDDGVLSSIRTHAITPETARFTHVFMQGPRNYAIESASATAALRTLADGLARRDKDILEAAAEYVGYEGWRSGVEFAADEAALRVRRIVAVMLDK